MTRDEYRRQTVATRTNGLKVWQWVVLILSIPLLLPIFLGDILAAPFTARRHESTFRWLVFTFARFAAPLILLAVLIAYLIRVTTNTKPIENKPDMASPRKSPDQF